MSITTTPSKHALLVVDVQDSFIHAPYWSAVDEPKFRAHQLALIASARAHDVPVMGILHEDAPNDHGTQSFRASSGHVRFMEWMPTVDQVFKKSVHNALTESGLLEYLHAHNITDLTISGIRTEQCCETTTRVASDLGFNVYYVTEATLTFAMTHADGTKFSADEIKKRTELVLAGRFANICSVAEMGKIWQAV